MYVKNRMTKNPICIDVNAKISDVVDIMSEKNLHRIPVVLSLIHILIAGAGAVVVMMKRKKETDNEA